MSVKRKAGDAAVKRPSKFVKQTSDSEYVISDASSGFHTENEEDEDDGPDDETPATPFSRTSSKYPSELKTHLCPFEGCTKAFNRPARLQEHLRSHNNERIFQCTYDNCEKTFLRVSHLNHHIKSAHTAVRDYVCDRRGCGKAFVTGTRLRRHLAAHDGRDKFRCTEYPPCNETFRKHATLAQHIMSIHLKQKPFPCQYVNPATGQRCSQAFDTAAHLRGHENRVHSESRFTCTECASDNLSFASYAELQAHIKSVHPPECPHCSLRCQSSRELRRHLEISHGDVSLEERRQFPCTVPGCGRSFTKKGNLAVHVRTVHEGEKRFVCGETDLSTSKKVEGWTGTDACGKRYSSKIALEEHVRTTHLGLQNSKAERRERLGLNKEPSKRKTNHDVSTMTLLTGEGYADQSGRHIACLVSDCQYRFYREFDLFVHMRSKHGYEERDIDNLIMERARLAQENTDTIFGIYGLEFDTPIDNSHDPDPFPSADAAPPFFHDSHIMNNEFDEKMNDIAFFNSLNENIAPHHENNTLFGFGADDVVQSNDGFAFVDPGLSQ
ncbi:C2H2 transcription factor (TFIIIA), putative [Talaromyces stipitatus ATCC 10500]|uniref:C2H2 transcription factor (TFIIIA), putative n=1 Tax=Talaromyces stipitatus (strain ATCC 10500 / CBS 375.48 / QM 6759 / NRRL 1006) TaxID=441959 RepID=B8MH45_TALSN|nr:C2H2 transcription factor (TFIIIA), putative [Talaromyces stipitatus ATCC 10500]EED16859.1 C2H2 transcription factor (TFIIIA), putative [Talaromyces stipitatus ATCC 10500]